MDKLPDWRPTFEEWMESRGHRAEIARLQTLDICLAARALVPFIENRRADYLKEYPPDERAA